MLFQVIPFTPETALIGGASVMMVHLNIMAQIYRILPEGPSRWRTGFDWLNYPLGFIEMLLVVPPYPYWEYQSWRDYVAASVAIGMSASVTAKKVQAQKEDNSER